LDQREGWEKAGEFSHTGVKTAAVSISKCEMSLAISAPLISHLEVLLSNDLHFDEKFREVIGLYVNTPEKALLLCRNKKSQCRALERTQPGQPPRHSDFNAATHECLRHDTLRLFAALNRLEGKLITTIAEHHRHHEKKLSPYSISI
jgi:hypothetical protein